MYEEEFYKLCKEGLFEVAKKLYEKYDIDTHHGKDMTFAYACLHGNLEFAKWLYGFGNVDIHTEYEFAFSEACRCGHLDVAKWLYKLDDKINIEIDNGYILMWVCIENRIDVIKWLIKIGINYYRLEYLEYIDLIINLDYDINKFEDRYIKEAIIKRERIRESYRVLLPFNRYIKKDIIKYL